MTYNMLIVSAHTNTMYAYLNDLRYLYLAEGIASEQVAIEFLDLVRAESNGRWWVIGSSWKEKSGARAGSSTPAANHQQPVGTHE